MANTRVFLPQEILDQWLTDGRVEVQGETMTVLQAGLRFELKTAVRFLEELAGGGDEAQLVGKVKDLEQLASLGGEHCADSVILDDNAYQVVEGFVGEPVESSNPGPSPTAGTEPEDELTALSRFFRGG